MKKRNQFTQAAILAVAGVSSLNAMAESASVSATVTVDNSIDFAATGSLNFGTMRATADPVAANCAYIILPADPGVTSLQTASTADTPVTGAAANNCVVSVENDAAIQGLGGTLERPVFTIGGVPAFTTLALTLPTEVEMTAPLAPGAAKFVLTDFTAYKTTGTADYITTTVQVDGTGGASFTLGAVIATDHEASSSGYENNVAYSGNVEVTVAYQ